MFEQFPPRGPRHRPMGPPRRPPHIPASSASHGTNLASAAASISNSRPLYPHEMLSYSQLADLGRKTGAEFASANSIPTSALYLTPNPAANAANAAPDPVDIKGEPAWDDESQFIAAAALANAPTGAPDPHTSAYYPHSGSLPVVIVNMLGEQVSNDRIVVLRSRIYQHRWVGVALYGLLRAHGYYSLAELDEFRHRYRSNLEHPELMMQTMFVNFATDPFPGGLRRILDHLDRSTDQDIRNLSRWLVDRDIPADPQQSATTTGAASVASSSFASASGSTSQSLFKPAVLKPVVVYPTLCSSKTPGTNVQSASGSGFGGLPQMPQGLSVSIPFSGVPVSQ